MENMQTRAGCSLVSNHDNRVNPVNPDSDKKMRA